MTPLPILLAVAFLGTGTGSSSKIVHWSFFLKYAPLDVREVKAKSIGKLTMHLKYSEM